MHISSTIDTQEDETHPAYKTPLYQKHNNISTSTIMNQDSKSWSMYNHPQTSFHDHDPGKENILEISIYPRSTLDSKNVATKHPLMESHTHQSEDTDDSISSTLEDHNQSKAISDNISTASYNYNRSFPTPPLSSTSTISILNHSTYHSDPSRWIFDENKWLKRKNDELKQTIDQLTSYIKELKAKNDQVSQELESQYISKIASVKQELIQQLSNQHEFIQSRQSHQKQLHDELNKARLLLAQKEDELKKCQIESEHCKEQLEKAKKESDSLKDQFEQSFIQYQKEISSLRDTISDLTALIESLKEKEKQWTRSEQSLKDQQRQINQRHVQGIQMLKEKWRQQAQEKLNQMKSKIKVKVPQYGLIDSLQNQVDSLQSVLVAEREASRKELESSQLRIETEWKDKVNQYVLQIKSKYKSLLENKISHVKIYYQRSIEEMKRDHQIQMQKLKDQHQNECNLLKDTMNIKKIDTDPLIAALDLELTFNDSMDHHTVNTKELEDMFSINSSQGIHQ